MSVGTAEKRGDMQIQKTIRINAGVNRVFRALTSSGDMVKCFPLEKVESCWNPGDEIFFHGHQGGADHGIIDIIFPPCEFQYRYWSDSHGTEKKEENYITIDYTLVPDGGGTQLNMVQRNLPSEAVGFTQSGIWDAMFKRLKTFLEKGEGFTNLEGEDI